MHMSEKSALPTGYILQGGRYRIVALLGSGGFGCTYIAEHNLLGRVAIKEFFPKALCNRDPDTSAISVGTLSQQSLVDKLRKKFIDEAHTLSRLKNDGLTKVHDVFLENGTAYYVMELIDGTTLSEIIDRQGPLKEAVAVQYFLQLCNTLQYVHNHNRLHLDIKPANIMITRSGQAMLIDFGTSKQYDDENGENTSTLIGLTPGYAPIEQMDNDVAKFYPATDVYALAASLYKALTGVTPPSAAKRISGDYPLVLPPGISYSTRHAIEAAMQLSKKQRTQTVKDFAAMLAGANDEDTVSTDDTDDATIVHPTPSPNPKPDPSPDPKPVSQKKGYVLLLLFPIIFIVTILSFLFIRQCDDTKTEDTVSTEVSETPAMDAVDMGLSVKWSAKNLGADIDYGRGSLYNHDDARIAVSELGGTWRLPSASDFQELIDKCDWQWSIYGAEHIPGYVVTSRINGNSIFLPGTKEPYYDSGAYWTAGQPGETASPSFNFTYSENHPEWRPEINYGMSNTLYMAVRPVCD